VEVMRSAAHTARVQRKAAALEVLAMNEHLVPALASFLAVLSRKPRFVLDVAKRLGRAHGAMHERRAPGSLPELNHEVARCIESARALPATLTSEALTRLRSLPSRSRLCHGDYHSANVHRTTKAPVIIDWGDASRGAPAADMGRTLLLLRSGERLPDTSAPMRAFMAAGRGWLSPRYLPLHRRSAGDDPVCLEDWIFVRVAARFNEKIKAEHPRPTRLWEETAR
jgi:thiamine kinase